MPHLDGERSVQFIERLKTIVVNFGRKIIAHCVEILRASFPNLLASGGFPFLSLFWPELEKLLHSFFPFEKIHLSQKSKKPFRKSADVLERADILEFFKRCVKNLYLSIS